LNTAKFSSDILRHSVSWPAIRNQEGDDIAEVHYYIERAGGPIIPGKRPDPKLLFEDGVMYHKEKLKNRLKRLATEAEKTGDS
jgi:hypothetical protein